MMNKNIIKTISFLLTLTFCAVEVASAQTIHKKVATSNRSPIPTVHLNDSQVDARYLSQTQFLGSYTEETSLISHFKEAQKTWHDKTQRIAQGGGPNGRLQRILDATINPFYYRYLAGYLFPGSHYAQDTFNPEKMEQTLRSILSDQIAIKSNTKSRNLTYLISGGKYNDIFWFMSVLEDLLEQFEVSKKTIASPWNIQMIVFNGNHTHLRIAQKRIRASSGIMKTNPKVSINIKDSYFPIVMTDSKMLEHFRGILSQHHLTESVDGIMHNLGGATYYEPNQDYFHLLHNLLNKNGWLQTETSDHAKAYAPNTKVITTYNEMLTNTGFRVEIKKSSFLLLRKEYKMTPQLLFASA